MSTETGLVPWCWTEYVSADYWHPAGNSRDEAIKIGKKRMGKAIFWIAPGRLADANEQAEFDCRYMVDGDKQERIPPKNKAAQALGKLGRKVCSEAQARASRLNGRQPKRKK